jgi:hypothetical protein
MLDIIYSIFRAIASVIGLEQVVVDAWEAVLDFFEMGGPIIPVVALVLVIMWIFMLERMFYFYFEHNKVVAQAMKVWESRSERKSWHAHRVREFLISEVRVKTTEFLGLIKVSVALPRQLSRRCQDWSLLYRVISSVSGCKVRPSMKLKHCPNI